MGRKSIFIELDKRIKFTLNPFSILAFKGHQIKNNVQREKYPLIY